jgi:hypothetical protein
MVPAKDGEDQLDQSYEKLRNITWRQGEKGNPPYNARRDGQLDWLRLARELASKTR